MLQDENRSGQGKGVIVTEILIRSLPERIYYFEISEQSKLSIARLLNILYECMIN